MSEKKEIFRKVAIERLSSSEQLDVLLTVVNPVGWIGLSAVFLLMMSAILWGVFGIVPTKVSGKGIIIKSGGVFKIEHVSGGKIKRINLSVGEYVKAGSVAAIVEQPEMVNEIRDSKATLKRLKDKKRRVEVYNVDNIEKQLEYIAKEKDNTEKTIKSSEEQAKFYEEKMKTEEDLAVQGLITKESLFSTRSLNNQTRDKIAALQNQMQQLMLKEMELKESKGREVLALTGEIEDAEINLDKLEKKLEQTSKVIASRSGKVLEITAREGELISSGVSIANIEINENNEELEGLIYVSAAEGKKIEKGMRVEIEPSIVKKEEFGFIIGKVKYVPEFPATREGMLKMVGNDAIVQDLSAKGATIEVFVTLEKSDKTYSGYKWSSPGGPPLKIYSGTICNGNVTVKKQRPIALVIPWLKEKLRIY